MRPLLTLLALTLLVCLAGCQTSDKIKPDDATGTAVLGEDLIIDTGYCRVEVSRLAIGSGTGQLAPGSKVKIEVIGDIAGNVTIYSRSVRISAKTSAGAAISTLNLSPAANVFLRYDFSAANRDGHDASELTFVTKPGTNFVNLAHTTTAPLPGTLFTTPAEGLALAQMTSFGDVAVTHGAPSGGGGPIATALTGTVSTLFIFTQFQLSNSGMTINATYVIPTSETTTVPKVLTLNDASFDAAVPTSPTNRILTVTTGGKTYTTDKAGASVTSTLSTFSGVNSTGSLVGTLVDQASAMTLTINYTFTTGASLPVAVSGTVADFGGRRTVTLSDSGGLSTILFIMPDTLPASAPADVTFDDASFDAGNPTDPAGRILTVTEGGTTYSSDVPVLGNVTVHFNSFAAGVSTGTIIGTVVSAAPSTKTLNYTFTTVAGSSAGGTGTLTNAAPIDVAATDDAVESTIVSAGTGYLALWLSSVGTTNRTIRMRTLDAMGTPTGTQGSVEPNASLDAGGGFSAAREPGGLVVVAGSTTNSATTGSVRAYVIDPVVPSILFSHTIATGTGARATYNSTANLFVVAYTTSAGVSVTTLPATGASFATPAAFLTGCSLTGIASAGAADEVLITGNDTSGIRAKRFVPSTLMGLGLTFDVTTSLGGGACAFDSVGTNYLIAVQETQSGITNQIIRQLPVGSDTLHATKLTMVGITAITQAARGGNGVLLTERTATFRAAKTSASGPVAVGAAIIGFFSGLNEDTTTDGPAIAGDATTGFVAVTARGTGGGVGAIKFTLTP